MPDADNDDYGAWPVFLVFLRVGLTSFGGPVAHLGDCRDEFVTRRRWLALFIALLVALPLAAQLSSSQAVAMIDAFYRAGSLVFGGGHLVLPLLQAEVATPGWVSRDAFLAGYGAAQAVPGPLFTFAAFLGASMNSPPTGWIGGAIALAALALVALTYWKMPLWLVVAGCGAAGWLFAVVR